MKKVFIVISAMATIYACGGSSNNSPNEQKNESSTQKEETSLPADNNESPSYDPKRGEGKFTADNVKIDAKLDVAKAKEGEKVMGVKCSSCHKETDEKLVGPGWLGVTTRRKPEWIMNFISNPDPMIEKDPEVQAQLEICLVRMPNQGLSDEESRNILEFMRKNDGVK